MASGHCCTQQLLRAKNVFHINRKLCFFGSKLALSWSITRWSSHCSPCQIWLVEKSLLISQSLSVQVSPLMVPESVPVWGSCLAPLDWGLQFTQLNSLTYLESVPYRKELCFNSPFTLFCLGCFARVRRTGRTIQSQVSQRFPIPGSDKVADSEPASRLQGGHETQSCWWGQTSWRWSDF